MSEPISHQRAARRGAVALVFLSAYLAAVVIGSWTAGFWFSTGWLLAVVVVAWADR